MRGSERWGGLLLLVGLVIGLAGLLAGGRVSGAPGGGGAQSEFLPIVVREPNTPTPTHTPTATATATPSPTPVPPTDWLSLVNSYRAQAALPPVTENPAWSEGDWLHARYMVKNDQIIHDEDPSNPFYSPEGDVAAESGNIYVSSSPSTPDSAAIEMWMAGPFHALGILNPALHQVGFGSYREADGGWQMGATLDVLRGHGSLAPGVTFPIIYPSVGEVRVLRHSSFEYPDPLVHCGYSLPSGPAIMVQMGEGGGTPIVGEHVLLLDGVPQEHCVFDESSYTNPDAYAQQIGRTLLNLRDAVVMMPRAPLQPGRTYTVFLHINGAPYSWTFQTRGAAAQESDVGEWRAEMRPATEREP